MTRREFEQAVKELPFGKRLPTATYVVREFIDHASKELSSIVERVSQLHSIGTEFNIVKFNTESFSISLLSYPEFWELPHPALTSAVLVDLATGRVKRQEFGERSNPPILHRKETFLPSSHTNHAAFAALTRQEEEAGLYADISTIGFRQNWQRLLTASGLTYDGHCLTKDTNATVTAPIGAAATPIARHRTAIVRTDLSRPVKAALESGLIHPSKTFLDFGCGQGQDVDALQAMGFESTGWDPVHRPSGSKTPADTVNLGYVLNVIEDPAERIEVLVNAWGLTRSALVVTGLTKGSLSCDRAREFGDGVITQRNTFQKFFDHTELQVLIEEALGIAAVPLGLGMFVVFRDLAPREDFLARRSRRPIDWDEVARTLRSLPRSRAKRDVYAENSELLDEFWAQLIDLGRLPKAHEYCRSDEVKKACGSLRAAHALLVGRYGEAAFQQARARRQEDLLVYLALAQFGCRRIPFGSLSMELRLSIEAFFDSYGAATKLATQLLYNAGKTALIEDAVNSLEFGWFDKREAHFTCHRSLLDELPAILRVYVGCGSQLYGDVREADLVKIHVKSQKLTCTFYDNFERRRFPAQLLRVKIDFGRLEVREFVAPAAPSRQVLVFKERFVSKNHKGYARMLEASKCLRSLGLDDLNVDYGLEASRLTALLERHQTR